jgi:TM2 domain-containing membrane protein YozV
MSKASDVTTAVLVSILVGAIIWFVLQVIIGVVAWVPIVAGGVVAVVGVLMAAGVFGARIARRHHRHHDSTLGAH